MSQNPFANRRFLGRSLLPLVAMLAGVNGCVERELVMESEPSGALVSMNDIEAGRTPASREFQWYGTYDVAVRKEGFETLKTTTSVIAPPWLWFPFDVVTELLPFTVRDTHRLKYTLVPTTDETVDTRAMMQRADDLQKQLQSGELTKTKPLTTKPADEK